MIATSLGKAPPMAIFRTVRNTRVVMSAAAPGGMMRSVAPPDKSAGPESSREASPGATTSEDSKSSAALPSKFAGGLAILLFLVGLIVASWVSHLDGRPTFTAAEGIGAFALFYVVAQAAERLIEMAMPLAEKALSSAGRTTKKKLVAARDAAVVVAVRAVDAGEEDADTKADTAAKRQADVDKARADRMLITFGATAAIGMALCAYLGADFLTSVGIDFTPGKKDTSPGFIATVVMTAVTGLAVGGGSKQLHDTIASISKSSDQKSTPAETGGTK